MLNHPDERIMSAADTALTKVQSARNVVEIKRIKEAFAAAGGQK